MNVAELFSTPFLQQTQDALAAMTAAEVGIRAAVVATVDGFAVNGASAGPTDPDRLAALASSMASIASVASQEVGLGRCASVTLHTDQGVAVVRQFRAEGHDLVLVVTSDGQALLAQVMYQANQFVRRMEALA